MKLFRAIPLFGYVLIFYNLMAFTNEGVELGILSRSIYQFLLPSGKMIVITFRDGIILGGLAILFIEVFKSTRTTDAAILDHTFSALVFIGFLVEFIMIDKVADSTFFLLGAMSLIDVMAGMVITLSAARKDLLISGR